MLLSLPTLTTTTSFEFLGDFKFRQSWTNCWVISIRFLGVFLGILVQVLPEEGDLKSTLKLNHTSSHGLKNNQLYFFNSAFVYFN